MIGTISHVGISLLVQILIGWATGDYWIGVIIGTSYYLGREIAQTEERCVAKLGRKFIAVREKLSALDPRNWALKGFLDWTMPLLATTIVALAS